MALYRALVSWKRTTDIPRDAFTNTLYFNATGITPIDPVDLQEIAQDIAQVYSDANIFQGVRINVRMYDMADQTPRPILAEANVDRAGTYWTGDPEVALCLSYYGERNLPRSRGRIYLGGFNAASITSRPAPAIMNAVLNLGKGLAEIGGENVSWRVYSPTNNTDEHIRHIWVNDEWDVVRSRGLRESTRVTADV